MRYFENCHTLDELKAEYRKLAKRYHPDLGGNCAIMQEINDAYKAMYSRLSGESSTTANTVAEEFIEIINKLLTLGGVVS